MTHDEWITAGRPHWQCAKCKGIFVTVAWPDDFICDLCKNPRLRNLNVLPALPQEKRCACGCVMRIVTTGTVMSQEDYDHWERNNKGASYAAMPLYDAPPNLDWRVFCSPDITRDGFTSLATLPVENWRDEILCDRTNCVLPRGHPHDHIIRREDGNVERESRSISTGVSFNPLGPSPDPILIYGSENKVIMRMDRSGNVELWGDVNEAALRFWNAVCQLSGGTLRKNLK